MNPWQSGAGDDEYNPADSGSSDDEETIAMEEKEPEPDQEHR